MSEMAGSGSAGATVSDRPDKPIRLAAPPSASERRKVEIAEFLEGRLAEARAGEIDSAVLIVKRVDGKWRYDFSSVELSAEWIGRLETVKWEWIKGYTRDDDE